MVGIGWKAGNPRRPGVKEVASVPLHIRITPEERAMWAGLARYLELSVSELVRSAVEEKRDRLVAAGKKPPRK